MKVSQYQKQKQHLSQKVKLKIKASVMQWEMYFVEWDKDLVKRLVVSLAVLQDYFQILCLQLSVVYVYL